MKQKFRLISVLLIVLLGLGLVGSAHAQATAKYHFVMISHIGTNDPNELWLTFAIADFQKRYPDVKIDYTATTTSNIEELVSLTKQVIATKPDGIAIPILATDPLDSVLRDAITKQGIPVVAFNVADSRPADQRIPYLAYVGGDELQVGIQMANELMTAAKAGTIPAPKAAVCADWDPSHQGLAARCKGFGDTLAKSNIKSEVLTISQTQADAQTTMESYLQGHTDVNVIFAVTAGSAPWMWHAANDLKLSPDVGKGLTILSVDESPVTLEGVKQGHLLATHSQGFYLQGYVPFELLYWNKTLGYKPFNDSLTGPIIIDKSNIDNWIPFTKNIFGATYDKLSQGQWQ